MWNDDNQILRDFYESTIKPTPKQIRDRAKKVAQVIEAMGKKYCLYKSIGRLDGINYRKRKNG